MKRLALGTSDFKKLIDGNNYFVDKTLIVKDFLEDNGEIVLLPRPRRFGKTLNLSIIRYFLEKCDEDRSYLFKGLKIEQEIEIMKKQGKYPVIYLTFKDEKHNNFKDFLESMAIDMSIIYRSFDFVIPTLKEEEKSFFTNIINRVATQVEIEKSVLFLSSCISRFYGQKVIILIDEYDTPIHEGHFKGYYSEIIGFMRNFLSGALKDNIYLEKAMVTGILRVAKESIFSGLNNLKVYTLLNERYSDKFGFTEGEVNNILSDFKVNEETKEFKEWYNGYIFGKTTIYNPWSVLAYLSESDRGFMPHWVNTSENSIIKTLLAKGDERVKIGLDKLYNGGFIETTLNDNIVMSEIEKSNENLWSFLLFSGYLKAFDKRIDGIKHYYKLAIPNNEILSLYEKIIENWSIDSFNDSEFRHLLKAITVGDIKTFSKIFRKYVLASFSYFDVGGKNPEKVYHAFTLGILVALSSSHEVVSNRESGYGRYDVSIIPKDISKLGLIIEFKKLDEEDEETVEETIQEALEQIERQEYETELLNRGIKNIKKLAIVFKGKEVFVREKAGE